MTTQREIADALPGLPGALVSIEETVLNWPSLMDALPAQIHAAVREGTYTSDLSEALRDAVETGQNFTVPRGTFPFRGDMLELKTPGQRLVGMGGLLKRLPNIDGIGILVSAADVELHGLRFDHTAPVSGSAPGYANDTIRIHGGTYGGAKRVCMFNIDINGSRGGGIALLGAEECTGDRIRILNVLDNSLLIAEPGANRNRFSRLYFDGTARQNNIYISASAGSQDTGEFIYDNMISDFHVMNSGDTNVECGYHNVRSRVSRGYCYNSRSPGLLLRDARGCTFENIDVYAPAFADQQAWITASNGAYLGYDGTAVVPLHEGALWDNDSVFRNVTVIGRSTRSGHFRGGSGVRYENCSALAFGGLNGTSGANVVPAAPATDGSDLSGAGFLMAGPELRDVVTLGGKVDGYATGDSWNYDGSANNSRKRCVTRGVQIDRCDMTFNLFSCVPESSDMSDNFGYGVRTFELQFASAALAPTATNSRIGLRYVNNKFSPEYFTNTGQRFNPGSGPIYGLKHMSDVELLVRPETRYAVAVILPTTYFKRAKLYIEGVQRQGANSDPLWGEFDLDCNNDDTSKWTVTKISGHADLYGTDGSTNFAGWSIWWASGALILQLRGADTGAVDHALKYRIVYA